MVQFLILGMGAVFFLGFGVTARRRYSREDVMGVSGLSWAYYLGIPFGSLCAAIAVGIAIFHLT